jgi:uncharacterized SAM-binding protein YcdF (DUF218 family)
MFLLKKIIASVILPPFSLILLVLAGLWLSRRRPKTGYGIAVVSLLTLLALSMPLVAGNLIRSLEWYGPIQAEQLAKAQAIVILGGGNYRGAPEYGGDTVGHITLERIRYGIHLQRQTHLPILVTGGAPFGGRPEADTMAESIREDFSGTVRWVENSSRDTAENAALSAPMLRASGISRIVLISQAWHLPRARSHFEHAGLQVIPAPTGFNTAASVSLEQLLPQAGALAASSRAIQEWLGILAKRFS